MNVDRIRDVLMLRTIGGRDRRAVIIGLSVLVPALLWMTVVRPYVASRAELTERIAAERALLEREQALIDAAAELPAQVEQATERAQQSSQRLVRAANMPLAEAEVTRYLENVAQLSRVLLQEVRSVDPPRGEQDEEGYVRPLRLALRAESDLEGVLTFLQRIESSPLLLHVAELSIEPSAQRDEGQPGAVQLTVLLHAFVPADIESRTATQEATS